ncbi:MAG: hypothetical protein B9S32_14760 [Verrucomicrobia bacterium Tous-C9LFEB]|nr:MAG: hypothetical protein B9S32_14760 [Verrucomicrobia bacterium Tous-C9LFEB]
MNTIHKVILILVLTLAAGWMLQPISAATLTVADAINPGQSTITITPGSTFTVSVLVTGLTSASPVDSFDLQLAALPVGLTLNAITSPLSSSGWFVSSNVGDNSSMGYASATGYDFYSDSVLLNYSLTADISLTAGVVGELTFSAEAAKNALYDSNGLVIAMNKIGLQVTAIPEPTSAGLLLIGLTGSLVYRRKSVQRR